MLEDEYSGVYRFAASVFPQEGGGDVVTGDYNAVSVTDRNRFDSKRAEPKPTMEDAFAVGKLSTPP